MARKPVIDPLDGPRLALAGRVVTMNDDHQVLNDAVVYVEKGGIVAIRRRTQPAPEGFAGVRVVATGGTLYPGLIELHNHLPYNILRLWDVPKKYTNRDQWGNAPEYGKNVTGPMKIVGRTPDLLPATVRYVECKALVGGVTTSQGIALFSSAGGARYYRGIVRNVEQTDEADLPEALTRVADVEAKNAKKFLARLGKSSCLLLHLSEGTDPAAHRHFESLKVDSDTWALAPSLAGIHCAALRAPDFARMERHSSSMVWSPLSNYLLYGATADVAAARAAGVRIALGSDWAVSGSKNLLGELKAARVASALAGGVFTDRELVGLVTRNAAGILGWQAVLGSLEPGKRADLLVVEGDTGDAYGHLLRAAETDISLVLVNGVARYGKKALLAGCGVTAPEAVRVGGRERGLFLKQESGDPIVGAIKFAQAKSRLEHALGDLPRLARALDAGATPSAKRRQAIRRAVGDEPVWSLALDELGATGNELRPRFGSARISGASGPRLAARPAAARQKLADLVQPLTLDPLTAADDDDFFELMERERNLPAGLAREIRRLHAG